MADLSKKLGFMESVSRGRLVGGSRVGSGVGSEKGGSMSESSREVESGGIDRGRV